MSGKKIDDLMQLWACTLENDKDPPFTGHSHMYDIIDSIKNGDVPWQRFSISWNGPMAAGPMPSWQVSSLSSAHHSVSPCIRRSPFPPHARCIVCSKTVQLLTKPHYQIREYEVFFRDPRLILHNQIGNPDYVNDIDYIPQRVTIDGSRVYQNFMSGDWIWSQAVCDSLNDL